LYEEEKRRTNALLFRFFSKLLEEASGGVEAERAEVTVEQVVRELKLLGFSDIRKVVSWRNELVTRTEKGKNGEPVTVLMPRVTIVDADKISDEAAAAVAEVSQTVNGALRVKMHDKHAALVSLGRHLGLFTDHVKVDAVYSISEEPMSAEEWKMWCQHCFASRIAAPEAETAMAEIDPMITHTMPLPDINKGFELMHEGKSIRSVRFLLSASSPSITSA
jgi:hypothetical protein